MNKRICYILVALVACALPGTHTTAETIWHSMDAPVSNAESITVDNDGYIYVGSFTGMYRYSPVGHSWKTISIPNPIIGSVAIDAQGRLLVGTGSLQLYRSADHGETWTKLLDKQGEEYRRWYVRPDPQGTIYVASSQDDGIYRSTNDGSDWEEMNTGLIDRSDNDFILDAKGRLLLCSEGYGLQIYDFAAKTWKVYPIPTDQFPLPVSCAAGLSNGRLFAARTDTTFMSVDEGNNWAPIFPRVFNDMVVTNDKIVMVASGEAFLSTTAGDTWTDISSGLEGLEPWPVNIAADSHGKLYYASRNNVFTADVATGVQDDLVSEQPQTISCPNPFAQTVRLSYSVHHPGSVEVKIHTILGAELATLVSDYKETGTYSCAWNSEAYPAGVYYCTVRTADGVHTMPMVKTGQE